MKLKAYGMKKAALTVACFLMTVSMTAVAQEMRSEISVQGTGFFTKDSDGNGIQNHATNTGGFLVGYRYNINPWLAAEANYGYARNTQNFFGIVPASVQANVHEITGSAVVNLHHIFRLYPYVLGGGGALVFDPASNAGGTFAGATQETRGTFLYGAGADYPFTRHLSLRAEYRGLVYKAPSFNLTSLDSDNWTHVAQPSVGFAFRF